MKTYIGDGVYAEIDKFGNIRLTTENSYDDDPRNVIVLERQVWQALLTLIRSQNEERRET